MRVFLICGKAGSGKNEVATIITEYYKNSIVTGFSKYIKLFAMELTDWDGRDFNKPRAYLQNMGDTLRSIDLNFMTKRVYEDLKVYKHEGIENVIISDVRLLNEIEFFKNQKDLDVITIRVNSNTSKRDLNLEEKEHHTETELDSYQGFDYVILNEFNERLKDDVINILEGMK